MKKFWFSILLMIGWLGCIGQPVQAAESKWVNDQANVLTPNTIARINQLSETKFKQLPGHPVLAVETLNQLPNKEDIDDYKADRFNQLHIGYKGWDNGLLFVLAVDDRKYGLEVGYGLEPALPDGDANQIVTSAVEKDLKAKHYDAAMNKVVTNIDRVLTENRGAISTPSEIVARRQQEQLVNTVMGGLGGLAILGVAGWFYSRHRRRQQVRAQLARLADAPLYASLPADEQARFARSLRLPDKKQTTDAWLKVQFSDYVRDNFQTILARQQPHSDQPLFVYDTKPALTGVQINQAPNLSAVLTLMTEQVATDTANVSQYIAPFATWATAKPVTLTEQFKLWHEFRSHVVPEDKLSGASLIATFDALLDRLHATDSTPAGYVPIWVSSSFTGGGSTSGNFGGGGGFSGGSSGGGGFSGGW